MRAIVLAAGEGTRLRPLTLDRPKCLVELAGRPLLLWQIAALKAAGVEDVTVVTGYHADRIDALGLRTIHNERFSHTNMVVSLMAARALLDGTDDVLICYGDLAYEPRLIASLTASAARVATTIDRSWRRLWELRMADPLADAETLRLDADGHILELGRKPQGFQQIEGQYMGLIKVAAAIAPRLVAAWDALDPAGPYDGRERDRMFMTSFLQHLIDHVTPVTAVLVDGGWLEVDTLQDLETYEALHASGQLDQYCVLPRG
jgi:choline kinase